MNFSSDVTLNATQFSPETAQISARGHHNRQASYLTTYLVLAVVSLLENIFVCIVHLIPRRNTRRLPDAIFINHCIANILQATCVVMMYLQIGSEHVKLIEFQLGLFYSASVLSLPVMCVWRYIKTLRAHCFQAHLSCNWVTLSLVAVWLPSLGVALPPFLGWGAFPLSLTLPSTSSTSHAVFTFLVLGLGPFLVMFVCNYKLFVRINSFRFRTRVQRDLDTMLWMRRRENAAKWMLPYQTVALTVCCMPLAVEFIILSCLPAGTIPPGAHFTVNSLALVHSLLAPMLHAVSNKQPWKEFSSSFAKRDRVRLGRTRAHAGINEEDLRCRDWTVGGWESSRNSENSRQLTTHEDHSQQDDRGKRGKKSFKTVRTTSTQSKRSKTAKVYFEGSDVRTDKEYRRYIATPSPKRMRSIQRVLQSSTAEFNSSIASISSNEFYLQQYKAPHFTNYRDSLRPAGFRQVTAGKKKLERRLSLSGREMKGGMTKRFLESRSSMEGDYTMQRQRSRQTATTTANAGAAARVSSASPSSST